jgi:hypothetical protein
MATDVEKSNHCVFLRSSDAGHGAIDRQKSLGS